MTLSELNKGYPEAAVGCLIGVAADTWSGQDFHGYTDLLTVGVDGEVTTYDFEPVAKEDGWDDLAVSNQGQCIRYINTGQGSRWSPRDRPGRPAAGHGWTGLPARSTRVSRSP